MEKRYQVFVSSTYEDLQDERKEVMQALLELDCIPAGMELFPASNDDQWTVIKRVIDDCDYYILIIGGRYGSTNEDGISYTQMEFEYALSAGKPIISFLPQHPNSIPIGKTDQDEEKKKKLDAFIESVKQKTIKYWNSPENLGSMVSRSMIKLIKTNPAIGWVKADSVVSDDNVILEMARLQRENEELQQQLQRLSTTAPKGTEKLAQGKEEVSIEFSYNVDLYFNSKTYKKIKLTWDRIFSCVAPSMIDECSETALKQYLNDLLEAEYDSISKNTITEIRNLCITQESFGMIIVQLRALGLIEIGQKKRSTSDKNKYWKLTPYGNYYMDILVAIKTEDS